MATEKCPICGQENHGLNLEETAGWFICTKCNTEVNTRIDLLCKERIPLLTSEQIVRMIKETY